MKHKKLPSLLALSISLELVLSPLPAMAETKTQNAMETIGGALNLGMQTYNTFRGQGGQPQMSPHVASDMLAFKNQQTPAADKHFTLNNMQKIPGLMEYIAKKNQDAAGSGGKQINPLSLNCQTLPTTLSEPNNEVCRNREVNGLAGDPKMQADEAFAYYNQYVQVEKLYQNYSVKSNVGGQSFGVGCMADAMAVLQGFFAYRLEQMDTMVTEFEAATAKFEEQSEMDLKSIRESTAVLNGESSKFAGEFKNSDLFDYGKRFENPACNSILATDDMDKLGKDGGGLMAIEKKLKADLGTTPPGSKYSPEAYLKNHADVVTDIKKMADKVSEQSTLNFSQISGSQEGYSGFLAGLGGDVSSDSGAHAGLNKALFSDLQTKFAKTRNALKDEEKLVMSELGGRGSEAAKLLSNIDNDATFDAEIGSLENGIKGECVNRSGIDTALSRIYDPTLSKSANKHSAEQIKKRIKAIISDVTISPEKKLAELKEIDSSGGSRYKVRTEADYETNEVKADGSIVKKKMNAAGIITPGTFFTDVIKNCESQYQVNKLNNKLSAKEAVKKLRTLKKEYQKAARQHSKDIKDEIVKKMVDCGGNGAVASSSTVGSCSPAKLDMGAPGFCAKAAFSCSNNMKQCTEKAQKFVKEIKDDRLKRTNNYNNNVESTRKQLVGMFDNTLVKYMKEAESMRAMFGAGFVPPKDIERDIKDDSKFDQKFLSNAPDNLEIKDPKKYLAMIKGNMENLRKQVDAQQQAIMGDDGPLSKHIAETQKNYKEQVISKSGALAKDCLAAYNSYKALVKAQKEGYDKAQGQLGEKTAKFCGRYEDVMSSNPLPGCDDGYSEVSDAMIQAAGQAGNAWTAAEAKRMRKEMADVCNKPGNQRSKDGKSDITAEKVCSMAKLRNDAVAKKAIEGMMVGGDVASATAAKEEAVKAETTQQRKLDKLIKDQAVLKSKVAAKQKAVDAKPADISKAEDELAAAKLAESDGEDKIADATDARDEATKAKEKAEANLTAAENGDANPTNVCDYLASPACKSDAPSTVSTTGGTVSTTTSPGKCTQEKEQIVANYEVLSQGGDLVAGTSDDPQPTQSTGDVGSFCNAGSNAGPFNTKGGIPQGGNPMAGQMGGTGVQH